MFRIALPSSKYKVMSNFSKVFSAELEGIDARLIDVEVDTLVGLHSFNIVGLADKALSEAKERVNSALKNSDIKPPNKENRKITVNLAPADIKKTGSQYDLAIAIGYTLATEQIRPFDTKDKIFVGELALNGDLRPVSGALSIAEMCVRAGFKFLFLPKTNAPEADIIKGVRVVPIENFKELINFLENPEALNAVPYATPKKSAAEREFGITLDDIRGQENAKRALIIAASGGHNLLMAGSPGAGKSLLAQSIISILPETTLQESIEITKVWSAAGLSHGLIQIRPFRAPHHSASAVSIIGGGTNPRPGEISLAHRGVLFLDELPEFPRSILESLRQPLESGEVHIARAKATLIFPTRFTLVAAMNPCPCGYFGDKEKECRCTANEVFKYEKRISGPLLDRIDLQITVPRVEAHELLSKKSEAKTSVTKLARVQVQKARDLQALRLRSAQAKRFSSVGEKNSKRSIFTNAEMTSKECEELIELDEESEEFLKKILEENLVSARGYYRILKTARTIADLEESADVKKEHLAEAFSYRIRSRE